VEADEQVVILSGAAMDGNEVNININIHGTGVE